LKILGVTEEFARRLAVNEEFGGGLEDFSKRLGGTEEFYWLG
jgi:phage-related protein